MGDRDPRLFRGWNAYMRLRQTMASSIVLKSSAWDTWNVSHAKLLAVLLWDYEWRKLNGFKYRDLLKKHAYRRSHNYRLLKELVHNSVLIKDRKGCYSLNKDKLRAAERAICFMREVDNICKELSETTMK